MPLPVIAASCTGCKKSTPHVYDGCVEHMVKVRCTACGRLKLFSLAGFDAAQRAAADAEVR